MSGEVPDPPRTVGRIVGVYDADGTVRGELAYLVASWAGRAHCALCDITHGALRAKASWRARQGSLPVPFATYHRDDQPEAVRLVAAGRFPVVVAELAAGGVEPLLGPEDLERCDGSVEQLLDAVRAAVEAAGLGWPGGEGRRYR